MSSSSSNNACRALAALVLLLLRFQSIRAVQIANGSSPMVPALFAFGDSIVDPGNNKRLITTVRCDFPPYGDDFIRHEATGRFSNGKITTDFIASSVRVKELLPAYYEARQEEFLTGVSFASGGSGYDSLTSQLAFVTSMQQQLEYFREYRKKLETMVGEKKATSIISEGLYILSSGSNDVITYFDNIFRKIEYDIPSYADFLMRAASNFTMELVNLGAKKIGVFGTPPVGCLPQIRTKAGGSSRECAPDRNQLSQLYNSKISRELQMLNSRLPATKLVYIDIYDPFLDLIQHPKENGFEESTKGCCGTGEVEIAILCNRFSGTCNNHSSYVFWDSVHPTERAYKIIVDQLVKKYLHVIIG